jgi:glycosyltransferase involved in cell wall biosynthesis
MPAVDAMSKKIFARALVVTACPPPDPSKDVHGIYRRLALFVSALGDVSEAIEMLHFVPTTWHSPFGSAVELDDDQSKYWGVRVKVTTVSQRESPREWWRYLLAPFTISARPRFSVYCGEQQLNALKTSLDQRPEIIFVHRLAGAVPLAKMSRALPSVFFDLDDIEHRVKWRTARAATSRLAGLSNAMQVPAMYWAERSAIKHSCRTFVCSEEDRSYLDNVGTNDAVMAMPNAVAMPAIVPPTTAEQTVLFLGGYQYEPNAQAAQRLIMNIWPKIRQQLPLARLIIAGAEPERIEAFEHSPAGVEFTHFVKDLSELYARSRVVCSPISIGGGTRVKIIEAAAWAKPIVSTSIGAEGLSFKDEVEILLRDDDDSIAAECVRLLQDDELCRSLGEAARLKARATYEVGAVRERIARTFIQTATP